MLNKLIFSLVVLFCIATVSNAQEDTVWLRIMQLSYHQEGDEPAKVHADVLIDETIAFENVLYSFTTEYLVLSPGSHILATAITDDNTISATHTLELEAGRYSVLVDGNYAEGDLTYVLIDESGLSLDETGSAAVLVNRLPESINVHINDSVVVEGLAPDNYAFSSLPLEDFSASVTTTDDASTEIISDEFISLPDTMILATINGESADEAYPILSRSSSLTVADYLQSQTTGGVFARAAALIESADLLTELSGDSFYTLFLPSTDYIDALPEGILPTNTTALQAVLENHIAPANLPPYELEGTETLTTLAGSAHLINFGETESGYWEIEGAPILWDVRLANGVIYLIDGVILP